MSRKKAPPPAIQKQEMIKCAKDPSYFINKYVKISEPVRGLIDFKTFPYQDECLKAFVENQYTIVNKSRQLGLSTLAAGYALWMCVFSREKSILVAATQAEVARKFQDKVLTGLDNLPPWLMIAKVIERNKSTLRLSNGSKVQSIAASANAARGSAVSLLVIDEAAHIKDVEELWVGIQPTLSTGGKAILISSPNGVGNLFHRIWDGAEKGTNNFKAIELPWTVHPERDQEWFEKQRSAIIAAQGERGVKQELLCQFNGSGDTFISGEVMDILESRVEPPKFKHEKHHHAWIWKEPVPGHKYVISADIARGNAEDYSTFCIIDIDEEEVVSDYRNKIDPVKFAEVLSDLGNMYNQAIIAPELNSYGLLTAKELKDIGYQNLFYEKYQRNVHMTAREIPEDELPGIVTSAKNRGPFLAKFESVLTNGSVRIYSKRLVEELKTFVWRAGKAQAQKGYNDDLVMAYAIAINLFENTGKQKYSEDEIRMAMFLGMSKTTKGLSSWTGEATGEELVLPIFSSNNIIGQGNKFIEKRKEMLTKQGYLRNDGSKVINNPQHPANPMWNEYKWLLD